MTCNEIKDLLDLFVDGDLSEVAHARVERHLLRCPDCAFQVRTLEQTRQLLRDAYPRAESSPAFRERMSARLHDAFRDVLRPEPIESASQRELPFLRENLS